MLREASRERQEKLPGSAALFSIRGRISRNALIKLASEVAGRIATFALVLWAARQLGESLFGLYNYGLALGFVVAQIADFGLQLLIAREIAVMGKAARPLVTIALRLKVALSLPVILLLIIFTAGWSGEMRLALLSLGLLMLGQTFLEFAAYVFRGQQALATEARLLAAARLLTALLGIMVLWLGGGLLGLALSSLAAMGVLLGRALYLLWREGWLDRGEEAVATAVDTAVHTVVDTDGRARAAGAYLRLLGQALPLGVAIFLSIAYTRLAVLLLQHRMGEAAVAHFSAAFRLVEPGQILPASLLAAVFPALSQALHDDPAGARGLGWWTGVLLALAGTGGAFAFWIAAPWLIPLLYGGAFSESVTVLQVLGLSTLPAFVNYGLTHFLIARGQQAAVGFFTGGMLLLHGVLSWQLIPEWGAIGPAVSIIIAEGLLFFCCALTLTFTKPRTDGVYAPPL